MKKVHRVKKSDLKSHIIPKYRNPLRMLPKCRFQLRSLHRPKIADRLSFR